MFTMEDIRFLRYFAQNDTKARVEDGVDWDRWRFIPDSTYGDRFSDGHDYAGTSPAPWDGWTLAEQPKIRPEDLKTLLDEIDALRDATNRACEHRRQEDRKRAATDIACRLRALRNLLVNPNPR